MPAFAWDRASVEAHVAGGGILTLHPLYEVQA